jgi:hypothetical protein
MLISAVILWVLAILSLIGIVHFNLPGIWLIAPAAMVALGYVIFIIEMSRVGHKIIDHIDKATHY